MSMTSETSRRTFLRTGAIVTAPLAAVGIPVAALAADGSKAKLARLEDERAIGELHGRLLRRINTAGAANAGDLFAGGKAPKLDQGLRTISPDHSSEPQPPSFSEDGRRASQQHSVTVEIARDFEEDGTLIQMARLQGNTLTPAVLSKTLVAEYVRTVSGWAVEKIALA